MKKDDFNAGIEEAARYLLDKVQWYPTDVFPETSTSIDAISGTTLRECLPRLAEEIRELKR